MDSLTRKRIRVCSNMGRTSCPRTATRPLETSRNLATRLCNGAACATHAKMSTVAELWAQPWGKEAGTMQSSDGLMTQRSCPDHTAIHSNVLVKLANASIVLLTNKAALLSSGENFGGTGKSLF
eukprot:713658-Amphidinium_carterae.2